MTETRQILVTDGELSGTSNDDTEFLSNSQYQLRKRKIPPKMAAASSKKAKKTFTVNSTVETLRASKNSRKTRKTRGGLKKDRKWKL